MKQYCIWLLTFVFSICTSHGQCSTTSFYSASTFTNNNLIGNSIFTNPENASADDGQRSISWSLLSLLGSSRSNYLTATNFNFSIPATATICGISVVIKKRATGINLLNWISDDQVRLIMGGNIAGNNQATSTRWTSTAQSEIYGGITDSWGTTLTAADINSPNFGIAIAAGYKGLAGVLLAAEIDYVGLQVHFNTTLSASASSLKSYLVNNTARIQWRLEEAEEIASMVLERSIDGQNWEALKKYKLENTSAGRMYEYSDHLNASGMRYYRLAIAHAGGRVSYSSVTSLSYKNERAIDLYPNPAANWINITSISREDNIQLFNLHQQPIPVAMEREQNKALIDISSLPPGLYFIRVNNKVKRFIKK